MDNKNGIDNKINNLLQNNEYLSSVVLLFKEAYADIIPNTKIWEKVRNKIAQHPEKLEKLESCRFKFESLKYHLYRMNLEEKDYEEKLQKLYELNTKYNAPTLCLVGIDATNVRIEFESFLLKFKSCLEIFIQIISTEFKNKTHKSSELKKVLAHFIKKDEKAKLILERLERAKWLEDVESNKPYETMRDIIAHLGSLPVRPLQVTHTSNGLQSIKSGTTNKNKDIDNINYALSMLIEIDSLINDIFEIVYC